MSERNEPAPERGAPAGDQNTKPKDPESTLRATPPGSAAAGESASREPEAAAAETPRGEVPGDPAGGDITHPAAASGESAVPGARPAGSASVASEDDEVPGGSARADITRTGAVGGGGRAVEPGSAAGGTPPEEPVAGESEVDKALADGPEPDKAGVDGPVAEQPESKEPGAVTEPEEVIRRYDCSDSEQRAAGLAEAASAVRQGRLVVIPTDTVYGIGADAFTPSAVNALLAAKGRGRDMPVPVLVGTVRAAHALVDDLGTYGQDLIDAFWPGPLTLICRAGRSLRWDLGETKGTVALRMPLHAVALDLLKDTGPMAVSSANRSGAAPARTAAEAEEQLGDSVAVYLDGGRCTDIVPSTILDLTTPVPRVLRKGAIPVEKLRGVIGYVATDD